MPRTKGTGRIGRADTPKRTTAAGSSRSSGGVARDDPAAVVLAFAEAYTAWERAMAASDHPFGDRRLKREYTRVLTTYCTIKRRAYVDGGGSFCRPPTYAELGAKEIAGVTPVTRSRTHVDTTATAASSFERRFVVLKKRDGWRIDSVKHAAGGDGRVAEHPDRVVSGSAGEPPRSPSSPCSTPPATPTPGAAACEPLLQQPVLPLAARRDFERLAVLGHRPPRHVEAGRLEPLDDFLVGVGLGLVLLADQF